MPPCQIKRNSAGELDKVLTGNGRESLAYRSLLEAVNRTSGEDIIPLRERFKSWEGKHIRDVNDPKELALAMYKQLYSPSFKEFFGDWVGLERVKREDSSDGFMIGKLSQQVSKVVDENGEPLVVYHGTNQQFSQFNKKYHGTANGGAGDGFYFTDIKSDAQDFGKNVSPFFINIKQFGKDGIFDIDEYVVNNANQIKSVFNEGNFNRQTSNVYQQTGSPKTTPSKASPATLKKISEFASRIGVNIHLLQELKVNGQKIGANGLADPLNGLIQIVNGKQDVALPEEAMHIAVELIEQKNPTLFKQLMNSIGSYQAFNEVVQDYKDLKEYQLSDGKPDINKLKKETIGKVLSQTIVDRNEDSTENPELLARARTFWQKIVDFLKQLFNRAHMNPFEEVAESILQGKENLGKASDLQRKGSFFQAEGNADKVRANLKLVNALKDSKALRWFDSLYSKGQEDTFFNKLQQDLQVPKLQVDMLKDWVKENQPKSLEDMMVGVLAEMSYSVEVNETIIHGEGAPIFYPDENQYEPGEYEERPSDHYSNMTVSGGTKYRENEIRTPNIAPSIKGHAAFSSDKGIGWFRSDDKQPSDYYNASVGRDFKYEADGQTIKNITRRILEVQSDLFQKGRDREDLIRSKSSDGEQMVDDSFIHERLDIRSTSNQFLQILNKENNWVTFFVKSIIQDSARKGYENVLFPSGNTAAKVEGHQILEDFIKLKEARLAELPGDRNIPFSEATEFTKGSRQYKKVNGKWTLKIDGEDTPLVYIDKDNPRDNYTYDPELDYRESERVQLEKEIADARAGRGKFGAINTFYENTIQNILNKQGYSPKRITDEHGNEWFQVKLNENRDLSEFYFQLAGGNRLEDKLKDVNQNLSKIGDKYELNGAPIKNTVFDRVVDYLKRRFRNITFTEVRQKEREFKQETEGKFKDDVKDILIRYVDDDGNLKQFPDDQSNPSAVNPYDSTYYSTLESSISDRLNTYPSGTKFYKSINIYDNINTAGTVDLLAVLPDGKVDILQYKAPILPKNATDIPLYVQETYNIEIEGLRSILQKGYGVDRKDFRQTRAIPIKVTYDFKVAGQPTSGLRVARMNIGNINVNLVTDDTLLPVPSPSETTGNERFDELLTRLRGLVQKLADERVTPDKRLEKTQGISSLLASIRKLQIQGKADGVLSSGRTVVKRQQEKYEQLKTKIDATDPKVATLEELNKIASDIEADRDQVELYSQLYGIFDEVFDDSSDQSKRYLKEARDISDDAQRSLGKFWRMAVDFRTKKMAAAVDIVDDFRPEKNISAYARLVRSLSQSPIKAGAILWKIVNNINNRFQLEFQDRYKATKELKDRVEEWMKGKDLKQLYSKIFQISPDGKWNGKVIQKFDKKFYEDLRQAKEKGDLRWVRANIDTIAYNQWFLEEHTKRVADSRTARVHENDEENKIRILQQLTEFVNTFSISKSKGVNPNNYRLNEFPLEDKWKSTAYKELEKPENEPVFDLYKHWVDRLKESLETGMIDDHNGWSWFPNVRKNLLEKLTTGKSDRKFISLLNNLRIETEDASFGKIDPLTGKSIDELHANYVHDLSEWVKDADGNYWRDFGEKSMDLFKVMALWDREIIKYSLKAESESLAKLLAYTEAGQSEELSKKSIKTGRTGKVLRNQDTGKLILGTNEINAKYIKDHIDSVWYGKNLSDESDISFSIPYKAAVEKINKLFGRELLTVPEEENINISGVKALDSLNRFFVTKTLGLNVFTSISNLFGGSVNSFINQGLYMTKKDLGAAELEYVSGRFWGSEQSKKTAGLIKYLHPYLEDKTMEEARHLSVSKAVRALSSDHLFALQRGSDNWVNEVIAISFINNTMIDDGKLVNIREFARKELGHAAKWSGTYEEGLAFDKKLEARVEELKKSPLALLNHAIILDDQISIPGIERMSPTVIALRQSMLQFVKDALGNTSREDLSLYKRSVMWQSFFMFKNWIPRMLDVRGQSLKFDPGSEKYEWGRVRMLGRAVYSLAANKTTSLLKTMLTANGKDLVTVAKDIYKEKQKYFAEQEQDFDMSEGEFIDMFIKGVRSEFKELLLAAGLMSLLVAARLASPDKKDDPKLKGFYKWMLRGLDKIQDEVSFFYNPASFTDIVNGSVFPGVGMLVDIQKFLRTGIAKGYYHMIGDDKAENRQKMAKYVFKILPVTKELMTYVAIFNDDIAKEYGIKISSQNGSSR